MAAIPLVTGPILSIVGAINSVINAVNAAVAGSITGLTTNTLPKATSAVAIGDSAISDNGTSVTITEPLVLTNQTSTPGALTGTLTNAPAVGPAQTWLAVSINGVAHFIPAWHV
jgi:hypothetical protein